MVGSGPFNPPQKKKDVGLTINPTSLSRDGPISVQLGWLNQVQHNIFNNNIIILKYILKNKKKSNFPKRILKIFVTPLHVFPNILHNIKLQTYTVRYISDIKKTQFPLKLQKNQN
jgi:hypothetical protein